MTTALALIAAAWLFGGCVATLFAAATTALGAMAPRLSVPLFWWIVNWSAVAIIALSLLRRITEGAS